MSDHDAPGVLDRLRCLTCHDYPSSPTHCLDACHPPAVPEPWRRMLDGSPCWCVSDEAVHEGWIHAPICEARQFQWARRSPETRLIEELAAAIHHDGCVHDSAGGRFCYSRALGFAARLSAAQPDGSRVHEPGDQHRYRIECEDCGVLGTIRLTVDPERAPDELPEV